jgi:hypothetical protein
MTPVEPARSPTAACGLASALRRAAAHLVRFLAESADATVKDVGPARNGLDWWPVTLQGLVAAFGLSQFEAEILLLCAGVEIDPEISRTVARLNGDAARCAPTFGLAFEHLERPHPTACLAEAPLRLWQLIDVGAGDSLTSSPLRIDVRILAFLLGTPSSDQRLIGLVDWLPAAGSGDGSLLPKRWSRIAAKVASAWNPSGALPPWPYRGVLHGHHRGSILAVAQRVAADLDADLALVHCDALPTAAAEQAMFRRLLERELMFKGAIAAFDFFACPDGPDGGVDEAVSGLAPPRQRAAGRRLLETLGLPALVLARRPLVPEQMPTAIAEVLPADAAERRATWQQLLDDGTQLAPTELERIAADFRLEPTDILSIVLSCRQALAASAPDDRASVLWNCCRERVRGCLDGLAARVEGGEPQQLVLPEQSRLALRQIVAIMRHRARLDTLPRGHGPSAGLVLFTGATGTGKTLAATHIGAALGLDVYRVDLGTVISKYIGETERNLGRLFDAAEAGGVILLFDEADALFGRRSEVRDSHDRYANIQINYLLQRLDGFGGLAILTTNMQGALDRAFARRIQFTVEFPHPDAVAREAIWRLLLSGAQVDPRVEPGKLARLSLAGGNIRNIAQAARCIALDECRPLGMGHLLAAARTECAKLGRPLTGAEVADWL